MASQTDQSAGPAVTHGCPRCSKSFSRLCDLNKHSKSHSRPYKCNDPTCKYNSLGWPTAKELERHHNDKHSATPRTFPCLFQPCPYWSKRESNCKQHMEKAHNWKYIRSKTKGKGSPEQPKPDDDVGTAAKDCGMGIEADLNTSVASSSPQPMTVLTPATDFILFDEHADAMGDDDDHFFPDYDNSQNPESYLPWTSPVTRLRDNELFIERFSQKYDGIQGKPRSVPNTSGSGLVPVLSPFGLYNLHHQEAEDQIQAVDDVFVKVEPTDMDADTIFARKRKYEAVEASPSAPAQTTPSTSGMAPQRSRKSGTGQAALTPSGLPGVSNAGGSSSEDGRRPKKKPKHNPAEDFTDTTMPDIFRHAHPHIYDRNRMDKYSACHTVHRDISTLVRHLSRPSHRLEVTERTISSFDVQDPDFRHRRAGVCRSCWQTFGDRVAFDEHKSRACTRVSKGKREKWRVLYESFTPLSDSANAAVSDIDPSQTTEEQWERPSNHLDDSTGFHGDGNANAAGTPPTSVPSPAPFQPPDFAPSDQSVARFVRADEHDKLQREHQALRERHQQLERMAQVLLVQQLIRDNMKNATAPGDDAKPPTLGAIQNSRPASSPGTSDRDSLVQHMDSQSTDVDVYGFMDEMEDTRQTLSRMNSGLSSASRSTIHRVPPSPPSRPAELPGSGNNDPPSQQDKHSLAHRPPPPSIPDSGYGTELRRGSVGDLPPKTAIGPVGGGGGFGPTPPSTAETAEQGASQGKMGEGVSWADSPSQRTARAGLSSPPPPQQQHSSQQQQQQPGFLAEHEIMSEFDNASYGIFFRDDSDLHYSHASPPGFTFESLSSQTE